MNGRVLVVCATRDRSHLIGNMVDSIYATSTRADVAIYVDDDHPDDAAGVDSRATIVVGPRIGPCASLNELVRKFPGYEAYGAATDDCEFMTPGWDRWVLECCRLAPEGIALIAPRCESDFRMDFPWATARWIEVVGSFCGVDTHHYYWDVALELLGELTSIAYAKESEFSIRHFGVMAGKGQGDQDFPTGIGIMAYYAHADARTVCIWMFKERRQLIRKLQAALKREESP